MAKSKVGENTILRLLGSRGFGAALLILIIITCAAGSLTPQRIGLKQCPLTSPLGSFFQLNDLYHSWWFAGLLCILGISLTRCTLTRLRGWPKTAGSFIAHLGLLIVLLGSLITAVFGQKAFMSVYKGQSQDRIVLNRPAGEAGNTTFKKLNFKIYLHDFIIDWYEPAREKEHRRIKDFKSRVAIIEKDNRVALMQEIQVNHPLQYKGYTFYQSAYDPKQPDWSGLEVVKDPGVPLVYAGFILLNAGVMLIFYWKPKNI